MRKSTPLLIAVLCLVGLLSVYQWSDESTAELQSRQQNAEVVSDEQFEFTDSVGTDRLAYQFSIESTAQRLNHEVLGRSLLKGELALKRQAQDDIWYGQVANAVISENGKETSFNETLYFTARIDNHVVSDVDFLGLNQLHPLNSVSFLLEQLSYDLSSPVRIKQASGSALYRYKQKGTLVTREVIEKQQPESQLNIKPLESEEFWQMTLQAKQPLLVDFQHVRRYQTDNGIMVVKQNVQLAKMSSNVSWQNALFVKNQNVHIQFNRDVEAIKPLTSYKELEAALASLAQSPDQALAKVVGQYLLANYGSNEIVELINAQDVSSNLASILIYSIQKAGGFEAEVMLAELFQHQMLSLGNKRRVLMSMGRFEGSGEQTLSALKQFSEHDNQSLADTALLSIGSLARFSKEQQNQVEDHLEQQLTIPERQAVAIIAIKNSGSTRFNENVEQLLGDDNPSVNIAAIKLLARDEKYQDKLLTHTTSSGDIQSISALRTVLAGQGRRLTSNQKAKVREAMAASDHPVLKKQLLALLNMENEHWDK